MTAFLLLLSLLSPPEAIDLAAAHWDALSEAQRTQVVDTLAKTTIYYSPDYVFANGFDVPEPTEVFP